jgi:hypothetical protein
MNVTAEQVKAIATEFESVDDEVVELLILQAENRMNAAVWGSKFQDGQIYLTAHLLFLYVHQSGTGNNGAVTSETVGPLSRSFSIGEWDKEGTLGSTSWGREYVTLRKSLFPARFYGFP